MPCFLVGEADYKMHKVILVIILVFSIPVYADHDFRITDKYGRTTGYMDQKTNGDMVFKDKTHRITRYITKDGIIKDKYHRKIGEIKTTK